MEFDNILLIIMDSIIFIYTLFLFISRQCLNKISSSNLSETTKSLFSNDSCIDGIINSDKKYISHTENNQLENLI